MVNTGAAPTNAWFQGNPGVFNSQSGADTSYIAADFTSSGSGPIANWLITPVLNISNSSVLSFFTQTAAGAPFLFDELDVLFSSGTSAALSGFTLLGSIGAVGSYPLSWTSFSFELPDVASGRIAFRQGGTYESANYIGLDTVNVSAVVTPVPEPSTYAMMVAGLAGIAFLRRKRQQGR